MTRWRDSEYEDRPHPDIAALTAPLALALFFAAMALLIGGLAVSFLPLPFWLFVVPALVLCVVGAALAVRRVQGLRHLGYCLVEGKLMIAQGRRLSYVYLADLSRVACEDRNSPSVIPSLPSVPLSGSIVRSARGYANRARGIVYLEAGGEWLCLSPTDPSDFLTVLERAIRVVRHAQNTSPQPGGDTAR